MRKMIIEYKSCKADILVKEVEEHNNIKVTSIMYIISKQEGQGHATGCITKIERLAKRNGSKEIWFPTTLSKKLSKLLEKRKYAYTSFGIHPKLKEEVFGWKKILKE